MTENYYELLGVHQTSSTEQILAEFKIRALLSHPDKGGDNEIFVKLSEAKNVLADKQNRKLYDNWLLLDSGASFSGWTVKSVKTFYLCLEWRDKFKNVESSFHWSHTAQPTIKGATQGQMSRAKLRQKFRQNQL